VSSALSVIKRSYHY